MIHECNMVAESVPCGCGINRCSICGAARSVSKCVFHSPKAHDSRFYYLDELHGAVDAIPRHTKVCAEFQVALSKMGERILPTSPDQCAVLEIGAGVGIYAPLFMQHGYRYEAVETDPWACKYIQGAYSPHVHNVPFESFPDGVRYPAIMAAHVLEHFYDAKAALEKMYRLLMPKGRLYLIIPDDKDLGNPDHRWFFTKPAIEKWLREVGFGYVAICTQQIVVWEDFIYAVAEKPE